MLLLLVCILLFSPLDMCPDPNDPPEDLDTLLYYLDIYDGTIAADIENIGLKMINTDAQLKYQKSTRDNGCIPQGIARQSYCKFSGNNKALQDQIQALYDTAASRTLDLIVSDTQERTTNLKNQYYSKLKKVENDCVLINAPFSPIKKKVNSRLNTEKLKLKNKHDKKKQTLPNPTQKK